MNDNMVTNILPSDHEFCETGWDRETATLIGALLASAFKTSSSGFPKLQLSTRPLAQMDDVLIEAESACVQARIGKLVVSLNARATVVMVREKDVLTVYAVNNAASNTLRAFASLIRSKLFTFPTRRLEIRISHKKSSLASPAPSPEPRFPAHSMHGSDHSAWPGDAEFSIRVQTRDRQFPDVKHETGTVFFSSRRALEEYIEVTKDWVKGTDGDLQITYDVYRWDWGPQYESSGSI